MIPLTRASTRPPNAPAAMPNATAMSNAIAVAPATSSIVSGAAFSTCVSTSRPWIVVPNGCDHDGGESRAPSIDWIEPLPGATSGPATPAASTRASRPTPTRAVRFRRNAKCRGRGSNPHDRSHPILSRARLTNSATPAAGAYRCGKVSP